MYSGTLSDEEDEAESLPKKPPQTESNKKTGTPKVDGRAKKRTLDDDASQNKSPKTPKPKINSQATTSEDEKKVIRRKPFNRLLDDVVFVISGFQNPLRANLRSKAMEMGAKYKADWDSSCTHLM